MACCFVVFVGNGGQFWPAVSLLGGLCTAAVQQRLQVASLLASELVGVGCFISVDTGARSCVSCTVHHVGCS